MSSKAKSKSKRKSSSFAREIIFLAGTLFIIAAVAAALLGYVNGVTEGPIEESRQRKIALALDKVIPGAEYEALDLDPSAPSGIEAAWTATAGGNPVGVCVQSAANGFGGKIVVIVGVKLDGTISGVQITQQSETPGLGTKTADSGWLAQFNELSGPLAVVKNTKTSENDIVAVTSATVSSRAVVNIVNEALSFAKSVMEAK